MLTRKPDPAPGYIAIPPFAREYTLTYLPPRWGCGSRLLTSCWTEQAGSSNRYPPTYPLTHHP